MGYYLAYVLLPNDVENIDAKVGELLARYDKNLKVAEYEGKCDCLYAGVASEAREIADAEIRNNPSNNPSAHHRVVETAQKLQDSQRAAMKELVDKAEPNPACRNCGGSGVVKTTRNPEAKFTDRQIGGFLSDNPLAGCLLDVVDDPNIVPVRLINLEEVPMPWVIVTPDGKWHAAGEPDRFGMARIDDNAWEDTARKILRQHADATLVVVECRS